MLPDRRRQRPAYLFLVCVLPAILPALCWIVNNLIDDVSQPSGREIAVHQLISRVVQLSLHAHRVGDLSRNFCARNDFRRGG
jgi:hypothetical protein